MLLILSYFVNIPSTQSHIPINKAKQRKLGWIKAIQETNLSIVPYVRLWCAYSVNWTSLVANMAASNDLPMPKAIVIASNTKFMLFPMSWPWFTIEDNEVASNTKLMLEADTATSNGKFMLQA